MQRFLPIVTICLAALLLIGSTGCGTQSRSRSIQGTPEIQRYREYVGLPDDHPTQAPFYVQPYTGDIEKDAERRILIERNAERVRLTITQRLFWGCIIIGLLEVVVGLGLLVANWIAWYDRRRWRAPWRVAFGLIIAGAGGIALCLGLPHWIMYAAALMFCLLCLWGFMSWWIYISRADVTHFHSTRGIISRAASGLRGAFAATDHTRQQQALDEWEKENYTVLTAHSPVAQFNDAIAALRNIVQHLRENSDKVVRLSEVAEQWKPIDIATQLDIRDQMPTNERVFEPLDFGIKKIDCKVLRESVIRAFKDLEELLKKDTIQKDAMQEWRLEHTATLETEHSGCDELDALLKRFRTRWRAIDDLGNKDKVTAVYNNVIADEFEELTPIPEPE